MGDGDDELINKWENEIAMGIDPDLTEGMSKEALEKMKAKKAGTAKAKKVFEAISDINEDFTIPEKFKSKFVSPNSKEDKQLRSKTRGRFETQLDPKKLLGNG